MIPTKALRYIIRNAKAVEAVIALEMQASLPIPVRQPDGRLVAAVFYYAQHLDPRAMTAKLYPPTWRGTVDWDDGRVLSLESAEPDCLGMPGDRFTPFADVDYRAIDAAAREAGLGGAVARATELDALYDHLLPVWLAGGPPDPAAARRFAALFPTVALPPMMPVYQRVGAAFFGWVLAAA